MWSFFKGVFTGSDHIEANIPCQDYADYTITDKGIYVAALADGASSSRYSDIAASCNVHSILNLSHRITFEQLLGLSEAERNRLAIASCQNMIQSYIKRIPASEARDFAATLMFVISDGKKMLLGHIGDGVICGVRNNREIEILSQPDNISLERDRTYFTVSNNAEEHMIWHSVENIDDFNAFILMSDGPEASFFDYTLGQMRRNNLLTITDSISKTRARETELIYYLKTNFWEYGITGDDCSILLMIREDE